MYQNAGMIGALCPKLRQREIVAEDLHVLDASSPSALDFDIEMVAVLSDFNNQVAGRVIKRLGVRIK